MRMPNRLGALLKLLFRRDAVESELDAEVQCYFDIIAERHMSKGVPEAEARRLARVQMTHPEVVKEQVRDSRTGAMLAGALRDVNYALRLMRKNPSFAIVTMLTLALGIGANSAIFSIVSRFVMQPLPVGDPHTLLALHTTNSGECCNSFSWPLFDDLRRQAKSFSGLASYYELVPASIGGRGEPERVWGQAATANFFEVAQLRMTLGRGFARDEEHSPVVVISHGLWQRRFGGDPNIAGKSVTLSGKLFTVIGVAGEGFRSVDPILHCEFWVPLGELEQLAPGNANYVARNDHWIAVVGRVRPGVTRGQVAAELKSLAQRLAKAHPSSEEDRDLGFHFERAGSIPPRDSAMITTFLIALTAVALLVLAIACANVANMFLAQAAGRQREMAMRLALGAARRHLLRQMMTESLLLALGGAVLGTAFALWATQALSSFHIPAPVPLDLAVRVDWRVLIYTFVISVGAGILFGLMPAWVVISPLLRKGLTGADAMARLGHIWSLRNLLVIAQIAMSIVLLCSAGLFLQSLQNASRIEIGFHSRGVLMMAMDPRLHGYSPERTTQFLNLLQQRADAVPGIVSASYTDSIPLSGGHRADGFQVVGHPGSYAQDQTAELYMAGPHYFDTIGIRVLAGRGIAAENPLGPKVAVVNEIFAQRLFPHTNPIGRQVTGGGRTYQIIGIVTNTKSRSIGEELRPVLYRSLAQDVGDDPSMNGYSIIVRYAGDAGAVTRALRREIHAIDPTLAIFDAATMEEHLRDALFLPRLSGSVFGAFGVLGLALAAVGLYGLVSYWVSQRTREIGIRLALGAGIGRVQGLIIRQGMVLLLAAVIPGLTAAFVLSKLFAGVLYGVAPHDPYIFTLVPVFLAVAALLACWIPSRRATTIQPLMALRHD